MRGQPAIDKGGHVIDLYTDRTPNGFRASIILEETGLPYRAHHIDRVKGQQQTPEFLSLNPAGAIPVIVDPEGPGSRRIVLAQSGAIMLYAAEKAGRFLPSDARRRAFAHQWFMQIATDITSASSWLFNHATQMPVTSNENSAWIETRLIKALTVADLWLGEHEYFADELSIADFLFYPNFVFRRANFEATGAFEHLRRWGALIEARPGVQRGMSVSD